MKGELGDRVGAESGDGYDFTSEELTGGRKEAKAKLGPEEFKAWRKAAKKRAKPGDGAPIVDEGGQDVPPGGGIDADLMHHAALALMDDEHVETVLDMSSHRESGERVSNTLADLLQRCADGWR